MSNRNFFSLLALFFVMVGCSFPGDSADDKLFELLDSSHTRIGFENSLSYSRELNPYTYRNFYNGGGVGIGDFNNDGLQDIFFTGNQVSNKLYLNEGNLQFRDITEKAGLNSGGVWSTGVSVVDINGDGRLDLYICKSGSPGGEKRHNELFINNGDSTFTEKSAEYGLDITGLATDAVFFDYDRDGDLDMYLLNNSFDPVTTLSPVAGLREEPDPAGGDRLYRNNTVERKRMGGEGPVFTDVSQEAGIYSSKIGFGLDVVASDFNRDGWTDLYITNDFFERDYLYINNQDGTFEEILTETIPSISLSSMGADAADINHDGFPEIYVTDMLPESWIRAKSKTAFDFWNEYRSRIRSGYYRQFVRNTLQLNLGPLPANLADYGLKFSEIGRFSGVEATDWSWSALMADLDLDGNNDMYVTNGIYKDLTDQDFVNDRSSIRKFRSVIEDDQPVGVLFDDIPSTPVANYAFSGDNSIAFTNKAEEWGLAQPGFSNGAAYADLDNDGDLDLVVNNVNEKAWVYENKAEERFPDRKNLVLNLNGSIENPKAVGSQVTAWLDGKAWYREQMPNRGFQSSVDPRLHFGFGEVQKLDSLLIQWPDGMQSKLENVKTGQILNVAYDDRTDKRKALKDSKKLTDSTLKAVLQKADDISIPYRHRENSFADFSRDRLLMEMHSTEGPASCVADINGDGLDDLYLGGAKGEPGAIYIQGGDKNFERSHVDPFREDKESEDTGCTWLDADGDGKLDLYVTSGGSEYPSSSSALADRLYVFGEGQFIKKRTALPQSQYEVASVAVAGDIDGDGDTDLFTGTRMQPFGYGLPADGHILLNDGEGVFRDATDKVAPELKEIGMITDAKWVDYDRDGDLDLVVVGEWMPVSIFKNMLREQNSIQFKNITEQVGLAQTYGLWRSLLVHDFDGDGYDDLMVGNLGLNSRLFADKEEPLKYWVNDFDRNGSIEQVMTLSAEGKDIPLVLKPEFDDQMPRLQNRNPDFESYASKGINELFTEEELDRAIVLRAQNLEHSLFWNEKGSAFERESLPSKTQLSPVYGMAVFPDSNTITKEGKTVVMGGNLSAVKPILGAYLSSYGNALAISNARELRSLSYNESGFFVEGEVRGIHIVDTENNPLLLVVRNNDTPIWFKKNFDSNEQQKN